VSAPGERLNDRQEDNETGVEDRYDHADKRNRIVKQF
jgi:hypothetical protein